MDVVVPALQARHLAEALHDRQRLLAASQRQEVLGRVACEVAHDVNNLLTVVVGCADLARLDHPEAAPLLDDIYAAATQAGELTWRLLHVGRPGRGAVDLDAGRLVIEHTPMLNALFDDDVTLTLDVVDDLWVQMDATHLLQVVLNLVVNARDAHPRSGVRVSVAPYDEHGTPFVRLEVSDDGRGMTDATLQRLFEPFFTTRAKGSGVGLATVKRIVDAAAGRIRVSSVAGQGATFYVELPRTGAPG